MSLRRSFAALLVASALPFATAAVAATPWGLAPGDFYSELSGSFYSSQDFFNDNEKRQQLGGRLDERVVRSHNEFGWRKWATLTLDMPFVSRTFTPATGPGVNSTGLGDIGLGMRIPMHIASTAIAVELGVTLPAGTNRALFPGTTGAGGMDGGSLLDRTYVPLRDTSTFFSQGLTTGHVTLGVGGGFGKRAFWALAGGFRSTFLSAGARDSSDRYADFTIVDGSLGWWFTNSLLVGGELRGEWQTSQGGTYDRVGVSPNDPELQSVRVLAGPRVTYRVDERMDVFAGSWHTPKGRNVVHHDLFYAGIAWKHTGLDRLAGILGGTK